MQGVCPELCSGIIFDFEFGLERLQALMSPFKLHKGGGFFSPNIFPSLPPLIEKEAISISICLLLLNWLVGIVLGDCGWKFPVAAYGFAGGSGKEGKESVGRTGGRFHGQGTTEQRLAWNSNPSYWDFKWKWRQGSAFSKMRGLRRWMLELWL